MAPLDADADLPPGQKAVRRDKWTLWIDGKVVLASVIWSSFDYMWLPSYFFHFGGGSSMLTYLFFVVMIGLPMMLLEVGIGQFMNRGSLAVWNIAPLFKGVGYMTTVNCAYSIWLDLSPIQSVVLFTYDLGQSGFSYVRETCDRNVTGYCETNAEKLYNQRWASWSVISGVDGGKVLTMLLALLLVAGISALGVRVIGKVAHLCFFVPHVLMLALFARVLTLPGADHGIRYVFYPNWRQLADPDTWKMGCFAALHSLLVGRSVLVTIGSHNRFHNGFLQDCLIATTVKVVMGLIIVATVMGAYGVAAQMRDITMNDALQANVIPMLANTMAMTPVGTVWVAVFFTSILLVSLNSTLWSFESVMVAVRDLIPDTVRFRLLRRKVVLAAVLVVPLFFLGIGYCSEGSVRSLWQLSNLVSSEYMLLLLCLLECAAVGWLYGARRFQANWEWMQGCCCCPYPLLFWAVMTPMVLLSMLGVSFVSVYWSGLQLISVASLVFTLLVVMVSAVVLFATRPGPLRQKWRAVTQPVGLLAYQLGPADRRVHALHMEVVSA